MSHPVNSCLRICWFTPLFKRNSNRMVPWMMWLQWLINENLGIIFELVCPPRGRPIPVVCTLMNGFRSPGPAASHWVSIWAHLRYVIVHKYISVLQPTHSWLFKSTSNLKEYSSKQWFIILKNKQCDNYFYPKPSFFSLNNPVYWPPSVPQVI